MLCRVQLPLAHWCLYNIHVLTLLFVLSSLSSKHCGCYSIVFLLGAESVLSVSVLCCKSCCLISHYVITRTCLYTVLLLVMYVHCSVLACCSVICYVFTVMIVFLLHPLAVTSLWLTSPSGLIILHLNVNV
jgi:hypothetical protein